MYMNAVSAILAPYTHRLSWFIMEALTPNTNLPSKFCIVHANDLVVYNFSDVYINHIVKFKYNHTEYVGKPILCSDDRRFAEAHLMVMQNMEKVNAAMGRDKEKRFLVQFNLGDNLIVHTVVLEKDICWPGDNQANTRDLIIRDNGCYRVAQKLYCCDTDEEIMIELQKLKNCSIDLVAEGIKKKSDWNPWMLVQFSYSPSNVIYAAVHHYNTVLNNENYHKKYIAYLTDGFSYFQSFILLTSKNRHEICTELGRIEANSLSTMFPINEFDEFNDIKSQYDPNSESSISEDTAEFDYTQPIEDNYFGLEDLEMEM